MKQVTANLQRSRLERQRCPLKDASRSFPLTLNVGDADGDVEGDAGDDDGDVGDAVSREIVLLRLLVGGVRLEELLVHARLPATVLRLTLELVTTTEAGNRW